MQIKTLITSGVLQHNLLNNKNIVLSALKIVLGFPLEFRLWFTYGNDSEILSIFIAKSPNLSFSRVYISLNPRQEEQNTYTPYTPFI